MRDNHQHHEELIQGLKEQFGGILEGSEQGVYIYLDDVHKVCNQRFASLLGYGSPDEWAKVTEPFPEAFVAEGSQEALVSAYQDAMERLVGSTNTVVWKRKGGGEVKTTVILVPAAHNGHLMALHFIS